MVQSFKWMISIGVLLFTFSLEVYASSMGKVFWQLMGANNQTDVSSAQVVQSDQPDNTYEPSRIRMLLLGSLDELKEAVGLIEAQETRENLENSLLLSQFINTDNDLDNPLVHHCQQANVDQVQYLVSKGANFNIEVRELGGTRINPVLATFGFSGSLVSYRDAEDRPNDYQKRLQLLQFLLKRDAQLYTGHNRIAEKADRFIEGVIEYGLYDLMKILLETAAFDVNKPLQRSYGMGQISPLSLAIKEAAFYVKHKRSKDRCQNILEIIAMLIAVGATVPDLSTVEDLVSADFFELLEQTLTLQPRPVILENTDLGKFVLLAAAYGSIGCLHLLTRNGENVNYQDEHGNSVLHKAVRANCENSLECVDLLLKRGADAHAVNDYGLTVLGCKLEVVRAILNAAEFTTNQ